MGRVTSTVLALVLAAAIPAAAQAAGGAGGAGQKGKGRVLTVIEHATTDATVDTGAKGDSAGDILTFANDVYDAADERKVGTDQGFCIRIVPGTSFECAWTTTLPGGQIMVAGPFYDTRDSELAITGGTGRYGDVDGTMRLHALAGGTKFSFQFRFAR